MLFLTIRRHGKPMTFEDMCAAAIGDDDVPLIAEDQVADLKGQGNIALISSPLR
jgi:hypothetical protein